MKKEYLFKAVNSFTENLLGIEYALKDNLFLIVMSYILDFIGASRASFLAYEAETNVLYNRGTLVYNEGSPVIEEIDDRLKYITIDMKKDFRNRFIGDSRFLLLTNVDNQKNYSTEIDEKLNIKPAHILFYPLFFQDDFIGLIEVVREKGEPFDEEEQEYFQTLLNFTSALTSNIYLYEWAIRDSLTNCFAITYFNKIFDESVAASERYNDPFTIFMMDIDNFKRINDSYGHPAGDKAIIFFSQAVKKFIRNNVDMLARYGGDEFCLLLKKCDIDRSIVVAQRILDYLQNEKLIIDNNNISFTTSIGIAQFNIHGKDRETIFKRADLALYKSKESGKNCYTVYDSSLEK